MTRRRPVGDPVSKIERAFGQYFTKPLQGWEVVGTGDTALIKTILPGGVRRWFCYMQGEFVEVPIH